MTTYVRPATGQSKSSGATKETTIIDALSDGLEAVAQQTNTIVLFGTSITHRNGGPGATQTGEFSKVGYFAWANVLLRHRFTITQNSGVSSDTTTLMLARYQTDVLDYAPGWCMFEPGPNDQSNGTSASVTISNITTMVGAMIGQGIRVILATVTPSTSMNSAAKTETDKVNAFIRDYARTTRNVVLADFWACVADPSTGDPVTGMLVDGVHPDTAGAARMGRQLFRALDPIVPLCDSLAGRDGAHGELLANPNFTGTSGGLAPNWSVTFGTATHTKVTRTDELQGEWQQAAITAGNYELASAAITTGFSVGDIVQGAVEFENDSLTGITRFYMYLDFVGSGTSGFMDLGTLNGGSQVVPWVPSGGAFLTPSGAIPAGTTSIVMRIRVYGPASALGTVRFGRASVRVL